MLACFLFLVGILVPKQKNEHLKRITVHFHITINQCRPYREHDETDRCSVELCARSLFPSLPSQHHEQVTKQEQDLSNLFPFTKQSVPFMSVKANNKGMFHQQSVRGLLNPAGSPGRSL